MERSFALTVAHWRKYPCVLWTKSTFNGGYGAQYFQGKVHGAHRVAFYKEFGYWPYPNACHHCDIPGCTQPYHLYEGTARDNYSSARRRSPWFRRPNYMKILPSTRLVKPGVVTARILKLCKEIK